MCCLVVSRFRRCVVSYAMRLDILLLPRLAEPYLCCLGHCYEYCYSFIDTLRKPDAVSDTECLTLAERDCKRHRNTHSDAKRKSVRDAQPYANTQRFTGAVTDAARHADADAHSILYPGKVLPANLFGLDGGFTFQPLGAPSADCFWLGHDLCHRQSLIDSQRDGDAFYDAKRKPHWLSELVVRVVWKRIRESQRNREFSVLAVDELV